MTSWVDSGYHVKHQSLYKHMCKNNTLQGCVKTITWLTKFHPDEISNDAQPCTTLDHTLHLNNELRDTGFTKQRCFNIVQKELLSSLAKVWILWVLFSYSAFCRVQHIPKKYTRFYWVFYCGTASTGFLFSSVSSLSCACWRLKHFVVSRQRTSPTCVNQWHQLAADRDCDLPLKATSSSAQLSHTLAPGHLPLQDPKPESLESSSSGYTCDQHCQCL